MTCFRPGTGRPRFLRAESRIRNSIRTTARFSISFLIGNATNPADASVTKIHEEYLADHCRMPRVGLGRPDRRATRTNAVAFDDDLAERDRGYEPDARFGRRSQSVGAGRLGG